MLSLLDHVRRHYNPHDSASSRDLRTAIENPVVPRATPEPGLVVYRFGVGLFYANAARFTEEALGLSTCPEPPRWFVLLADAIDDVDFTGGQTLAELVDQLKQRGVVFAVAGARAATIQELEFFGVTEKIGHEQVFGSLEDAIAAFQAVKPSAGSSSPATPAAVSPCELPKVMPSRASAT